MRSGPATCHNGGEVSMFNYINSAEVCLICIFTIKSRKITRTLQYVLNAFCVFYIYNNQQHFVQWLASSNRFSSFYSEFHGMFDIMYVFRTIYLVTYLSIHISLHCGSGVAHCFEIWDSKNTTLWAESLPFHFVYIFISPVHAAAALRE